MTVAVSTAAAITQIQSVIPAAYDIRIQIAFASISLITIANLRGLRESGNIFAVPTYLFVGLALAIVGIGAFHIVTGTVTPVPPEPTALPFGTETLGILLLLKAFAGGSVALTGVEAIANGVPAFKPPEAKNAANTMTIMAVLLAILFIGMTVFADAFGLCRPATAVRRSSRWSPRTAFGEGSSLFYLFADITALILFLAANTSFNAFPRLAAILAEDGYMPRQFSFRGDRLAYSLGDRAPGGHRVRPAVGIRRRHACVDPAVLGRGVPVLHAQPGRAWSSTGAASGSRAGAGGSRSTPSARC